MEKQEFEKMVGTEITQDFYDLIEDIYMTFEPLTKFDMFKLYKYGGVVFNRALIHFKEKKQLPEC